MKKTKLEEKRSEAKLTTVQLVLKLKELLNCSNLTILGKVIFDYEQGKNVEISDELWEAISKILNCSVADIKE
ncbi:hypothetical protein [Lactococcus petauri]|uniref:hypothetical protein n=1 Tax=Lactococcus petauri TaxID=1940789 RepID=UPI00254FB9F9|nr:hypothetical protein [Lactococcus petauri]